MVSVYLSVEMIDWMITERRDIKDVSKVCGPGKCKK